MPAKKQITREKILEAATQLLLEGGMEAVNIKALAKALHCSTQPIYLSFENMEDLRRALIPLAVQRFAELLRTGTADNEVPCLYDMNYIRLAQKEPQLFRFLFVRRNAFAEAREALRGLTEYAIERFMQDYELDYDEAHFLHDQLWMQAHGIASMLATGFCDWDMEKAERMLRETRGLLLDRYKQTRGKPHAL